MSLLPDGVLFGGKDFVAIGSELLSEVSFKALTIGVRGIDESNSGFCVQ